MTPTITIVRAKTYEAKATGREYRKIDFEVAEFEAEFRDVFWFEGRNGGYTKFPSRKYTDRNGEEQDWFYVVFKRDAKDRLDAAVSRALEEYDAQNGQAPKSRQPPARRGSYGDRRRGEASGRGGGMTPQDEFSDEIPFVSENEMYILGEKTRSIF